MVGTSKTGNFLRFLSIYLWVFKQDVCIVRVLTILTNSTIEMQPNIFLKIFLGLVDRNLLMTAILRYGRGFVPYINSKPSTQIFVYISRVLTIILSAST